MVFRKKKDGGTNSSEVCDSRPEDEEKVGEQWIWTAIEARSKLLLGFVIGKRTIEFAELIVKKIAGCLAGERPLFTTDELASYKQALLNVFGTWHKPAPTGRPGRPRLPTLEPADNLLYATVKKRREEGVIIEVTKNVVFGREEDIQNKLAGGPSKTINTSYIERSNLDWRMWDAHLSRKSLCFAKSYDYLQSKFAICVAFYNLCRTHKTLTRRNGGKPTTPAIASGILDCAWGVSDILCFTSCQ